MDIEQDVRFSSFPGRNTPLLDRPFGNASPGCFVFARNPFGLPLDFTPIVVGYGPPDFSLAYDGIEWALGDVENPFRAERYSILRAAQDGYANVIDRGSQDHCEILQALDDRTLRDVPSRVGVEAAIILDGDEDQPIFVVGNHADLRVNPTRSPIPYSAFVVADDAAATTMDILIANAVVEMCEKQLSLEEDFVRDDLTIHTIYTLGRRLQTQIACTIDLRGTGITHDAIAAGYDEALEGGPGSNGRHNAVEFLDWNKETIDRFAGSYSYRSTKQNLSAVFFAAAADHIIPEEKAYEYVGARSAERELAIAKLNHLNRVLDGGIYLHRGLDHIGPRTPGPIS